MREVRVSGRARRSDRGCSHIRRTNWVFFSDVHCDAVYLGKARAFTDVYLSRARGTQASGPPAGAYRAIAPDFRERSNEPIDLLIGM